MISHRSGVKTVGLDIGTYSIKATVLDIISGEKTLKEYTILTLPAEAKTAQKEKFINDVFQEMEIKPDTVNLSISGPEVIVRFIDLPTMSKEQLENALVFEAEKYIPFDVNEVILDSIILGEGAESGQMKVLLAAAKKELVEELVKITEEMGISINCIDIDPFAMFNSYMSTLESPPEDSSAFLILGNSTTDILISSGAQPCFMRQIQIAGKDITEAISESCSVSFDKAEEIKKDPDGENKEKVLQATSSVLDDLVRELQLSFGYFENRYNKNIQHIMASGGMIYQEGVLPALSDKLGMEVKKWDPLKDIKLDDSISKQDIDTVSSLLAVSLGLSLRG